MKYSSAKQVLFSDRFLFVPARHSLAFRLQYWAVFMTFLLPLVFGRVIYSTARRLTARAAQQCKSPGPDAIKSYNDAASSARTTLEKLRTANTYVKSDAIAINLALKKVTADEAMAGLFANVADLLEAGVVKNARF